MLLISCEREILAGHSACKSRQNGRARTSLTPRFGCPNETISSEAVERPVNMHDLPIVLGEL